MADVRFRPLDVWPRDRRRHHDRAQFSAGWTSTRELLGRELGHLGARNAVILVDCPPSDVRADGTYPKANARVGYPGVVVAFDSREHGPLKYVADRYSTWTDNVRAIALGLEALRKVDRYGITKRGEQYRGWAELPAGIAQPATHMTREAAARFIAESAGRADTFDLGADILARKDGALHLAYRHAAKRLHPDAGGDPALFQQLQAAKALLEREAGRG